MDFCLSRNRGTGGGINPAFLIRNIYLLIVKELNGGSRRTPRCAGFC